MRLTDLGRPAGMLPTDLNAHLNDVFASLEPRLENLRGGIDGEGRAFADVLPGQESFRLRPLLLSNAWLQRPGEPTTLPAGHAVAVFPLGHLDATGCLPRSAEHAA